MTLSYRSEGFAGADIRPQELAERDPDEGPVSNEIPRCHPPRLLREPVDPFETRVGHPAGGPLHLAGDEVERAADAEEHGRRQDVAMPTTAAQPYVPETYVVPESADPRTLS